MLFLIYCIQISNYIYVEFIYMISNISHTIDGLTYKSHDLVNLKKQILQIHY